VKKHILGLLFSALLCLGTTTTASALSLCSNGTIYTSQSWPTGPSTCSCTGSDKISGSAYSYTDAGYTTMYCYTAANAGGSAGNWVYIGLEYMVGTSRYWQSAVGSTPGKNNYAPVGLIGSTYTRRYRAQCWR
jgi:hypothetical protein